MLKVTNVVAVKNFRYQFCKFNATDILITINYADNLTANML